MHFLCRRFNSKQIVSLILASVLVSLFTHYGNVQAEDSQISPTIIGSGNFDYVDGLYYQAAFQFPNGLAADEKDKLLYIADTQNHRIRVLDLTTFEVKTVAGNTTSIDRFGYRAGGFQDGPANEAMFNRPSGLALAENGAIFIADTGNHMIRMLYDGKVYTVAGNGTPGYKDGKGIEASFRNPSAIAIGSDGSLYVSDTLNHVIRKIDQDGKVSTLVGDPSNTSILNEPTGITFDKEGVLYIADSANHQIKRLIDGKLEVVAGSATEVDPDTNYLIGDFVNGSKNNAKFNFPKGITFSMNDLLIISDSSNHAIRAITKEGKVYTIAGSGMSGYDWDEHALIHLDGPNSIHHAFGRLFISDTNNNRVVMIPANYQFFRSVINFDDKQTKLPIFIDGVELVFPDVQPFVINGSTKVPVRFLAEALGAEVKWVQKERSVIVEKNGQKLIFREADGDFFIKEGRSIVGLRFLVEKLGYWVDWNQEHRSVIIETFGG